MSQQTVELIQIVVSVDGELCRVTIPEERKHIALRLLGGLFDDGRLAVRRLPARVTKVALSELEP